MTAAATCWRWWSGASCTLAPYLCPSVHPSVCFVSMVTVVAAEARPGRPWESLHAGLIFQMTTADVGMTNVEMI